MPTTLTALAAALPEATLVGPAADDVVLIDAVHDSRAAGPGVLFCALPGAQTDGHDHAAQAVRAGAPVVLVERELDLGVPQLVVPSTRAALGAVASHVHDHPSRALRVVGVTGTNGKTTTVALVEAAAAAAGLGTGVVGTTGARVHGMSIPNDRTTPEATDLQRLLRSFVDRGVEVAAIEVSSHGLALDRIDGTHVAAAGFTMLGEDHLDFHGDMASYLAAKQRLFTPALSARCVVVVDDAAGSTVAADAQVPVTTLSTYGGTADVVLDRVRLETTGSTGWLRFADGREVELHTRLVGHHNLANAALALLLAVEVGVPLEAAVTGVATCPGVAGRLERVEAGADGPVILVDYAHTPDALRIVIAELRQLLSPGDRLAVVVGAGGDRDRGKRAPMGAAAAAADLAVLTTDNPRSENPEAILDALMEGVDAAVTAGSPATIVREVDRRKAIATALAWAAPGDVVLIAGKGHETGQQFADHTDPFDDRQVAAELVAELVAGGDRVITLTLADVAAAVGGRVIGDPSTAVSAVATDSRAAAAGSIFVALRGESADGHGFVGGAMATGAAAAMVEHEDVLSGAGVVVTDCWQAIGALGAHVRTVVDPAVLAVTGSVGKTTTKDLLRAALAADRPTVAAEGSFNNELGVPLTLLGTQADTKALVVEIGARGQGHIASLTPWVRPDVSIVTAVAGAHLEMFGDLDSVAQAKGELVEALTAEGTAVLNRNDKRVWAMRDRTDGAVLSYGHMLAEADVTVVDERHDELGRWGGRLVTPWGEAQLQLPMPGHHNLENALAAVAAAGAIGVPLGTIVAGLANAALSRWRAELAHRADGLLVVNDAYNANRFSMEAALDMLADLRRPGGRLVAVLGHMAELGPTERHDHDQVGNAAGTVADLVIVTGKHPALELMRGAAAATGAEVIAVESLQQASDALRGRVGADDVVLCKASRSACLDVVAAAILDDDTPRDDGLRPRLAPPSGTPLEAPQ